ncbi:MAG TPA: Xaa-Pro aminopeptidase [Sunxiuqinia sp.]|nr:Xaa-Pro aminopeptidase [Sunxiuqinia sp.]
MFNPNTYIQRRKKLKKEVNAGILLFLGNVDAPMNCRDNTYHFRQDSNFLYFFGLDYQRLAGIIDVNSGDEILFGDDLTMDDVIWMGPQESLKDKSVRVGVKNTRPYNDLFTTIREAVDQGRQIHFTPPYRAENMLLLQQLTSVVPGKQADVASVELIKAIVSLRSVKEACEIDELEKAAAAGYKMHVKAMQMAQAEVWEQKIAGTIEGISLAHGSMPSFPIILSQHGETLHNHNHSGYLEVGKLLLVDAGAETTMHYASDFTRTSPVGGRFSQQQREIYEIVLAANNRALELTKPGITYQSVHLEACKVIANGLKSVGIMKGDVEAAVAAGAHALFMPHGLGHMMGLDVHDMEDLGQIYVGFDDEIRPSEQFGLASLRMGRRLQEGFVVTNEPGIYFIPALIAQWKASNKCKDFINYDRLENYREFGGIRLEDDLLITAGGCRLIGERIPITPEGVEATIQQK